MYRLINAYYNILIFKNISDYRRCMIIPRYILFEGEIMIVSLVSVSLLLKLRRMEVYYPISASVDGTQREYISGQKNRITVNQPINITLFPVGRLSC
jgi:hypothetical protein